MDIVGDRKFVEVPGERTHELPPLLVRTSPNVRRLDRVVGMANNLIDAEDMIASPAFVNGCDGPVPEFEIDRRKMDLAINLADQYLRFVTEWQWGDLLRPDVWPHAGRSSFVMLLEDKAIPSEGVELEKAVGMRLTFRQPPPISCFSNQFLFYLNSTVASTAFDTWANLSPAPLSCLPPERFTFDVIDMSVRQ